MSQGNPFERDKLIRFHHCDPAGIVFYPQYFVLFNELVEDWFNQGLDTDFAMLHARDRLGVPMARVECEFLTPSKIGETLHLRLAVKHLGSSSFTLMMEGGAEGVVRVRAKLVLVMASLDTFRAVAIPEALRARMQQFAA